MSAKLSDHVSINRQFLRSVRLDADLGRVDAMQGYILQPSAQAALETMAKHLATTQQRAFTWTGPYGGGKSSLALALASLAGGEPAVRKAARTALSVKTGDSLHKVFGGRNPWAVIPLVGRRTSLVDELGAAIDKNLRGVRGRKPHVDGRRDVIAELVRAAETRSDIGGVLLIIDELGKYLEHAAQHEEDIGFYQDLAEAASRTNGNLVVIGVLHQAFEQYATRLGQATQQEWAKIQGRYVDIPLVAGSDEMVALIGRALEVDIGQEKASLRVAEKVSKVIRKRRPGATPEVGTLLAKCWPLHPVTAAFLGPASKKRFGQNERSVFSFLASAEPLGFKEVIDGLDVNPQSYYWPHQFWEYLRVNFEPAIAASSDGHRWAICAEAVERAEARFSLLHVHLVKTVGLIEILRNGSGLAAERELLEVCVPQADQKNVEKALNELVSASILIFRKHLDAYGVYAGSDFDIEAAVRTARSQVDEPDLSKISELIEIGPVTARRHYWQTGAMRWFSRNIIHQSAAEKYIKDFRSNGSQCGEFLLVLGDQSGARKDVEERQAAAKKLARAAGGNGLLIGAPRNADRIEDLIQEVAALQFVRKNSQQLDGDGVALRELSARTQATQSMLSDELRDAFHNACWYTLDDGMVKRHRGEHGLSHLASDLADMVYGHAPEVHSELINRDVLSSNAAKAQRELLHSMLQNATEPNLGYTSFSADAGLYHTVVRALGLHSEQKGRWRFHPPSGTERSESMLRVWGAAEALVFDNDGITKLSDLYAVWQRPPIGVKAGLLPIFALSFFLANRNQLALYIEGMFTPEVTDAHIDEWLQDPSRIGWRYVRIEASEKRMLAALASALSERLGSTVAPDALDSARALVRIVYQLPQWTRRTRSVSAEAQEVRQLLIAASDPHKVLFADLPLILGTREPSHLARKIAEITGELNEAFEKRLRQIEQNLFRALDHDSDASQLRIRGSTVAGVGAEFRLESFAVRLSTYEGALTDIEGLLTSAINKPSRDWNDHDVDAGEIQLLNWSMEFRRLESLAAVRGRPATRQAIGVVFGSKKTVTGTFDVSASDGHAVSALVNELFGKLNSAQVKREVLLAAIAEVGAMLVEQDLLKGEKKNG